MNTISLRIPYADTDQMGMVYYANYLVYFERGRTELLRVHGLTYKELEQQGVYLPVVECSCNYVQPACYDDELMVTTTVCEIGFASVEFSYEIKRDNELIVQGKTRHPFVNKEMKPIRVPKNVKSILEKNHG